MPWPIPVVVDPQLQGGAVLLRSDTEQTILAAPLTSYEDAWKRVALGDPALMEDCLSLTESAPWTIRIDQASDPIRCECCGTEVMAVPEGKVEDYPHRRYRPAIWEATTVRKHTFRRCEAMRERKLLDGA